jgi:hypothetical protein
MGQSDLQLYNDVTVARGHAVVKILLLHENDFELLNNK